MEDCRFETSELQASLMMSTPLFTDSWSLCNAANCEGVVKIQDIAGILYVAIPAVALTQFGDLIDLKVAGDGVFPGLASEEKSPVMVDSVLLSLFCQSKINEGLESKLLGKKVVITGHSTGGALASLTALYLLSQPSPPFKSLLCITFGSPLLGNQSLSSSISRSRLAHNFCHIVSIHDLVPRTRNEEQFWSFGTYLFCSDNGGVCLDNSESVRKMFQMLNMSGSTPNIEEHQRYGHYVFTLSHMFLKSRSGIGDISDNSYQTGVALAVDALGFSNDNRSLVVKECIETATRIGRAPILRSAELANELANVLSARLEIQWYKDRCDASKEELGYYDFFKRSSMRRDYTVNLSRKKLARFWDGVIEMVEKNELPYDFTLGRKWVFASQFYQLLAEPLDIANFYKSRGINDGHYLDQGNRPKRYEVIDKWWTRKGERAKGVRSRYTSTTQDTCFWAKLEEAKECLDKVRSESSTSDMEKKKELWEKIVRFESYANMLVKNMEVSVDVLAKNSSYRIFERSLREFKIENGVEMVVDEIEAMET